MRPYLHIIVLSLSLAIIPVTVNAQKTVPCANEVQDTESELRELGVGNDSTAFGALTEAVKEAMQKLRPRFRQMYPGRDFEYSLTIDKSEGNIELDTSIGRPEIVCNDVAEDSGQFKAYVVISFEVNVNEKQE